LRRRDGAYLLVPLVDLVTKRSDPPPAGDREEWGSGKVVGVGAEGGSRVEER
jgi:hypothetical protein